MKVLILGGDGLMEEVTDIARKYAHRCDRSKILCVSLWRQSGQRSAPRTQTKGPGIEAIHDI